MVHSRVWALYPAPADTFYGSGKASASDRIFARLTSIVGVVFVIIAIVLNLIH